MCVNSFVHTMHVSAHVRHDNGLAMCALKAIPAMDALTACHQIMGHYETTMKGDTLCPADVPTEGQHAHQSMQHVSHTSSLCTWMRAMHMAEATSTG